MCLVGSAVNFFRSIPFIITLCTFIACHIRLYHDTGLPMACKHIYIYIRVYICVFYALCLFYVCVYFFTFLDSCSNFFLLCTISSINVEDLCFNSI